MTSQIKSQIFTKLFNRERDRREKVLVGVYIFSFENCLFYHRALDPPTQSPAWISKRKTKIHRPYRIARKNACNIKKNTEKNVFSCKCFPFFYVIDDAVDSTRREHILSLIFLHQCTPNWQKHYFFPFLFSFLSFFFIGVIKCQYRKRWQSFLCRENKGSFILFIFHE